MPMRVVTFKVSRRLVYRLDDAAVYYRMSRSEAIRRALVEFIEEPPVRLEAPVEVLEAPVRIVSVKIPEDLLEAIDKLRFNRYRGAHRSELIREAIWRWLEKHQPRIKLKIIALREPPAPTRYLAID